MSNDSGLNLDLPYIDYPTGWAIQRAGDIDHHAACSAQQTGGVMLCDCNGLIYKWADLKWKHERAKAWDEGKHSEHTPACRLGDGDCICPNPYRPEANA